MTHKKIPVRCIGISPAYYTEYLQTHFAEEYVNPYHAFAELKQEETFPDLMLLLKQVENYRGNGLAAEMFYEGKVSEVIARLIERTKQASQKTQSVGYSTSSRLSALFRDSTGLTPAEYRKMCQRK